MHCQSVQDQEGPFDPYLEHVEGSHHDKRTVPLRPKVIGHQRRPPPSNRTRQNRQSNSKYSNESPSPSRAAVLLHQVKGYVEPATPLAPRVWDATGEVGGQCWVVGSVAEVVDTEWKVLSIAEYWWTDDSKQVVLCKVGVDEKCFPWGADLNLIFALFWFYFVFLHESCCLDPNNLLFRWLTNWIPTKELKLAVYV